MNDLGKWAKKRLIDLGKNQMWLVGEIRSRTGLYCDTSYLAKIFNGERKAPKIVAAIHELLKEAA